jgi:hypothetical protein
VSPDVRPIHHWSWRRNYSPWGAGMGHAQRSLSATCALACAQPPGRQPKRHLCVGVCRALRQDPMRHMYAGLSQHTGRQPKRSRIGRPSARWLQPGVRPTGVACLAPMPGSQTLGVCLQPSAWALQATASPHAPTNSAFQSESTHSLQYPRYSAILCITTKHKFVFIFFFCFIFHVFYVSIFSVTE